MLYLLGTCYLLIQIPFSDVDPVSYEHGSALMKIEFYPPFLCLKEQGLYPLVSYRSDYGIRSHLAAYVDALNKSRVKITADSHGRDKGRTEHLTVLERCVQKVGQSPVRHFLIFNGDAQMKVLPAIAPIGGKAVFYPFRALGGGDEDAVVSAPYEIPTSLAPFVRFLDEKVGGKAQFNKGSGRALLILQLVSRLALRNDGGIPSVPLIHFVYKAVLASGTYSFATVPRVPSDRLSYFIILHILTPVLYIVLMPQLYRIFSRFSTLCIEEIPK